MTDHPYLVLCDRAMCSPDIRHLRGESFQWLADRIAVATGESWTADQVHELEDSFYAQLNAAASHDVGRMRL